MAAAILPAELMGLIKFATKKDITNYVAEENLPDYMGGRCRRNYRYVPPGCKSVKELAIEHGYSEERVNQILPMYEPLLKEAEEALAKGDYYDPVDLAEQRTDSKERDVSLIPAAQSMIDTDDTSLQYASMASIDSEESGPILRMLPSDIVQFSYDRNSQLFVAAITVYNTTRRKVAFKVQSNRPQAYSVSPRCGILYEGGSMTLHLRLLENCDHQSRDKFLILARTVDWVKDTMKSNEFAKLWSVPIVPVDSVQQKTQTPISRAIGFKLSSSINRHSRTNGYVSDRMTDSHDNFPGQRASTAPIGLSEKVSQLTNKYDRLERRIRSIEMMVYFTMILLFGLIALIVFPSLFNATDSRSIFNKIQLAPPNLDRIREGMSLGG